jgi:asparagine synthase (glutamine-hydrolysing)
MEISFYLKNQLLKDTDFMSMYHSVETRVPFLDHTLVDYISSTDPALKIDKSTPKPLLVRSLNHFTELDDLMSQQLEGSKIQRPDGAKMQRREDRTDVLPVEIVFRSKQGFAFPFGLWMKKQREEIFKEPISKGNLNTKYVESIYRKFEQGNLHWSRIWACFVLTSWQN